MPWSNPERWLNIPIIGLMLGFFWKDIANKKKDIDLSLVGFVTEKACFAKQENMMLGLKKPFRVKSHS